MAQYTHISELMDFRGLDLRSSELTRPKGFSTDGSINEQHSPQGAIKTRNGTHIVGNRGYFGKLGIVRYDTTDMLGVSKSEIVGFGGDTGAASYYPYRLVKSSFTLTNSHLTEAATVTHFYDTATSQFRFKIVRTTTLIDQALGNGQEGSPYFLDALDTAVSALASFAMTAPTSGASTPAAFMELIPSTTIAANGGTLVVYYYYWEAIPTVDTSNVYATLINHAYEVGLDTYRNVSAAVVRGCLYMSSGSNAVATLPGGTRVSTASITKYDGQDFYVAGFSDYTVSAASGITSTAGAYAGVTDAKGTRNPALNFTGTYSYRQSMIKVDKAGNRLEVFNKVPSTVLTSAPAGQELRVDALNSGYMGASYGYGLRTAIVNGTQNNVLTITVDAGHTMTAGSIAYFWDANNAKFIQREVTAIAATTITISGTSLESNAALVNYDAGGVVSVIDNAAISNNLRIGIYRTKASLPGAYYLVAETPVYPGVTVYYDETADDQLGAQLVDPVYPYGEPPKARYLASFNDQLIASGNDRKPNTVYFSDLHPENFPRGTHSFDLPKPVTGQRQTSEVLACATRDSIHVVSGDLRNFVFRVDKIGANIGVASHDSMKEFMEGALAFASYKGPYVLIGGRDLKPLGMVKTSDGMLASRLEPYFTTRYGPLDSKPVLERATACVLPNSNLYILFIPTEAPSIPGFATSASATFAYDFARDAWYKWTGLNCAAGLAVLEDEFFGSSRVHDGGGTIIHTDSITYLYQQQLRKSQYNYADHDVAISFVHKTNWETLGMPGLFKRFLRTKIYSHETREAASAALTVKTYMDYDATSAGLSFTNVLTWTATTTKSLTQKIKAEVCRAIMHSFESSEYYKPQIISGIELEAVANFRQELKE